MSGSVPPRASHIGDWFRAARSYIARRLSVTFTLQSDPESGAIRAATLAFVVGVAFALLGIAGRSTIAEFFAESPIALDLSLRALSFGWFDSDRTVPISVVEIDEGTNRGWGSPAITPRDQLTQILEVVTSANPAAVVVDIDLSWGHAGSADADPGLHVLRDFLQRYDGPAPLIFPKRIDPAADGTPHLAESPLDDVFERNSRLAWAHASFETGGGGAVRDWHDWLSVCTASGPEWLPSVVTRLEAMMSPLPKGLERPVPPMQARACEAHGEPGGKTERLLIGPRVTGERRSAPRPDAQTVSASLLVDPEVARDDARLFAGRVVFIGATHTSSGDFWLTPSGVLPGVELLANTVRFAPLQSERRGWAAKVGYRSAALLLFAIIVLAEWYLRGLVAFVVSTVSMLVLVMIALGLFGDLGVFDSVEAAILLFIWYKFLETVLEFIEDFKARRRQSPAGFWSTLRAVCFREHKPRPEGH
jgi:hypothetical protein